MCAGQHRPAVSVLEVVQAAAGCGRVGRGPCIPAGHWRAAAPWIRDVSGPHLSSLGPLGSCPLSLPALGYCIILKAEGREGILIFRNKKNYLLCSSPPAHPPIFVNITVALFSCQLFPAVCQDHLGSYLRSSCARPCLQR